MFSFHYDGETENEFDKFMELWSDVAFLKKFAEQNSVPDVEGFVHAILANMEQLQDYLEEISREKLKYGIYFQPLQDSETRKILSLQKGKIRDNKLRFYAIKLDKDCYVVTGAAIKMSQRMQDHPDTHQELIKLQKARLYLQENGVFDGDSFYELIIE